MTAGPACPGRALPVYQAAVFHGCGGWTAPERSSPSRSRGVSTPIAGIRNRAGGATVGWVRGERKPAAWSVVEVGVGVRVEVAAARDAEIDEACVPPHPASPAAARASTAASTT